MLLPSSEYSISLKDLASPLLLSSVKKWLPPTCEVSWLLSLVMFSWYVYSDIWIYCRMTEKKLIYHLLIVLFSYQVFQDTYLPISTKKLVVQIGFGMLYWLLVYFQVIYESVDLLHVGKNRSTSLYERGHRLDVKRRQHSIPAPPLL